MLALAQRKQAQAYDRNHPVFQVSLLEPYDDGHSERPEQANPRPVEVDGEKEWEVKEVVNSHWIKKGWT